MILLEGNKPEEYLKIVVDVQKNYLLLDHLKETIDYDSSVAQDNGFIRERAKEAKESVLIRVMYGFLIYLFSLIAFAETWGLFIFWVYFLIEFWKDGFNNLGDYLWILFMIIVLIGWLLIIYGLWYNHIKFIKKYRKELKNTDSISYAHLADNAMSKAKAILLKQEVNDLKEVWNDWTSMMDYWNSESYDVKKMEFKKAWVFNNELERCAVMYEYILFGKCTSLEGEKGAYELMKSDVKHKRIETELLSELFESPEQVRDTHPILYEALVYINDRKKSIPESNDEILNEYISRYGTQTPSAKIIKGLYEKTECYAFVQECRKKLQEYEDWRIQLTGKTYSEKKKRLIDY